MALKRASAQMRSCLKDGCASLSAQIMNPNILQGDEESRKVFNELFGPAALRTGRGLCVTAQSLAATAVYAFSAS